jgi:hypothetical protein
VDDKRRQIVEQIGNQLGITIDEAAKFLMGLGISAYERWAGLKGLSHQERRTLCAKLFANVKLTVPPSGRDKAWREWMRKIRDGEFDDAEQGTDGAWCYIGSQVQSCIRGRLCACGDQSRSLAF